jgi:Mrp family chromosome partitioning ATPase
VQCGWSRRGAGCRNIAIANGKGGVGKAMTTTMLAAVFGRYAHESSTMRKAPAASTPTMRHRFGPHLGRPTRARQALLRRADQRRRGSEYVVSTCSVINPP